MMSEEESEIYNSKQISKMLNRCIYIYVYIYKSIKNNIMYGDRTTEIKS